jgi:hypothetical protein
MNSSPVQSESSCSAAWADPAGNWTYLLDESTPRPVAATIAVLASKLTGAKPLGKFYRPGGNVFHLFEKNGKPILVAASAAPRRTILNLGSGMVTFTDYQGNERTQAVANGPVALNLEPMGVFIEGGDLRVLQSYLTLSIGADRQPVEHPKVAAINAALVKVPLRLRNPYTTPLRGSVSITGSTGWPAVTQRYSIPAGREVAVDVAVKPPPGVAAGDFELQALIRFEDKKIPSLQKPLDSPLISPDMVGNLLRNGDFEQAGNTEQAAASWSLGKFARRYSSNGGTGIGKPCAALR